MPRQLAALLFFLLLSFIAAADTLSGTVTSVLDGDTLYVLDAENARHKVRLAGIDTPEHGQPFSAKSKQYLLELVAGKAVDVQWSKRGRYVRYIGKVLSDGRDVNLAMVRAGLAWWFRRYRGEQSEVDQVLYEAAEDKALAEGIGLWRDPDPVPWDWRRR